MRCGVLYAQYVLETVSLPRFRNDTGHQLGFFHLFVKSARPMLAHLINNEGLADHFASLLVFTQYTEKNL